jgi:hypothetical protein
MRIQLCIPDDLASTLVELAFEENRSTRRQAKWLLWQAIDQAIKEHQAQSQEVICAAD